MKGGAWQCIEGIRGRAGCRKERVWSGLDSSNQSPQGHSKDGDCCLCIVTPACSVRLLGHVWGGTVRVVQERYAGMQCTGKAARLVRVGRFESVPFGVIRKMVIVVCVSSPPSRVDACVETEERRPPGRPRHRDWGGGRRSGEVPRPRGRGWGGSPAVERSWRMLEAATSSESRPTTACAPQTPSQRASPSSSSALFPARRPRYCAHAWYW